MKRSLIGDVLSLVILVGCSNAPTQESATQRGETRCVYSGSIPYDSAYWSLPSPIDNENQLFVDTLTDLKLDSMEKDRLEVSKQVLRDLYIAYWMRNFGEENDLEPYYYRTVEEYKEATSAFLNLLYHYFYLHGYKKIDEGLFKQKLETFFHEPWESYSEIGDFYGYNFEKDKIDGKDGLSYCPWEICSLEERVIYDYFESPLRCKIKGEKCTGDGYDEEENMINPKLDMESCQNGELVIDEEAIDLDKLLNVHLFVFNDNKAAKNWLLRNHLDCFFQELCFYDDDDEINREKLKYIKEQCTNEYGNVYLRGNVEIVTKGLMGKHGNMMRLVFDETDKALTNYEKDGGFDASSFEILSAYFHEIWVLERAKYEKYGWCDLNDLCMFAKMEVSLNKKHCCESHPYGWFNNCDNFSILSQCLNDSLLNVAKRHNYYEIPNFDEVLRVYDWDIARNGQDDGGLPFDYTTLLP